MQYACVSYAIYILVSHHHVGTKKLKCSGDQPTCARCLRETITCVYSPQKQMGRPKKRQRAEHEPDEEAMNEAVDQTDTHATFEPRLSGHLNGDAGFTTDEAIPNLDPNHLVTAFEPDGTLQPWMLPIDLNWDFSTMNTLGFENAVPSLTPDTSSNSSPPTLNVPPEPHDMPHTAHETTQTTQEQPNAAMDATGPLPTCACLSTLYLTLSNLSTMDSTFSFPTALHPLREAMSTASQVISCEVCPIRFITGLQNVQLLNALLMSLAERFSRVLTSITTEAKTLESHNALAPPSEQKSKAFRLADLSTPGHLHTGGLHCAAAFSLSFSPAEWRSMAKKVVRAEVYGPQDGNPCCPYLLGLITQMEKRQDRWHKAPPPQDYPRDKDGNVMSRALSAGQDVGGVAGDDSHVGGHGHEKGEHLCLKMLAGTRRMVETFDWD